MDIPSLSIRAFYDRLNKTVEKHSKEAFAAEETAVLAEVTHSIRQVGPNCLVTVEDFEGRQMLWMVGPEEMGKCLPGTVALARGQIVLWPSLKKGKRLEWLQVKSITIPLETAALSRARKRQELAKGGLFAYRAPRDWPVTTNRSGVRVHLVANPKDEILPLVRGLFLKGKRFHVITHGVNMDDPGQVAGAIAQISRDNCDFCLLIQREEDNPLVFDAPEVLRALQKGAGYVYLIQPQAKVKPFAYYLVSEWRQDAEETARDVVVRCWRIWRDLGNQARVKEALMKEAERDRVRFASELGRLKQENRELREELKKSSPQRVLELEEEKARLDQELKKAEERRKTALNHLFSLEQENKDLKRDLALLEEGQKLPTGEGSVEEAVRRAVVEEEFKRSLVEEERDKLAAEVEKLRTALDHYNLLEIDSLEKEINAWRAEAERSEDRRDLLSEMLFLLEQENRELKGRLGFREDLEVQEDVTGYKDKEKLDDEALVVGKARLLAEVRDLLIQEELERLQRENKRLRSLMESVSPAAFRAVQEQLEDTSSRLEEAERRKQELTLEIERLQLELGQTRQAAGAEALERIHGEGSPESDLETEEDGMDHLLDKAFSFFRRMGRREK